MCFTTQQRMMFFFFFPRLFLCAVSDMRAAEIDNTITSGKATSLSVIPTDILFEIFKYLGERDLTVVGMCCHRLYIVGYSVFCLFVVVWLSLSLSLFEVCLID